MEYQRLFSPMKIGNMEVKNRVVMTAMGVNLSNHDGTANEKTVAYYKERVKGGLGLIITEYTRVNLSLGICSNKEIATEMKGCCNYLYMIGDADKPGRIKDAIHQAYELSCELS